MGARLRAKIGCTIDPARREDDSSIMRRRLPAMVVDDADGIFAVVAPTERDDGLKCDHV
jgi:hypothetical protein